jgi:hypothetical protein
MKLSKSDLSLSVYEPAFTNRIELTHAAPGWARASWESTGTSPALASLVAQERVLNPSGSGLAYVCDGRGRKLKAYRDDRRDPSRVLFVAAKCENSYWCAAAGASTKSALASPDDAISWAPVCFKRSFARTIFSDVSQ